MRARVVGDPRPELLLQHRQHGAPHPHPGVRRVAVVRVVPELDALDLAGGDGVGAGHVEERAHVRGRRPRRIPASDRPPEPAGQAEQHGLGLVVAGVAEQDGRPRRSARRPPPGTAYRARRAAASGPRPAPSTLDPPR